MIEPRSMYDWTGWHSLSCKDADDIMHRHRDMPTAWKPASALTDPDGLYGPGVIFTEWWWDDMPVLRTYRWTDSGCTHYGAVDMTAAMERGDDE